MGANWGQIPIVQLFHALVGTVGVSRASAGVRAQRQPGDWLADGLDAELGLFFLPIAPGRCVWCGGVAERASIIDDSN
jgi:hypothetical protein